MRIKSPSCRHANHSVRVSSHTDLRAGVEAKQSTASTYCCHRPECQDDAKRWVHESTGREAVVVSLPPKPLR